MTGEAKNEQDLHHVKEKHMEKSPRSGIKVGVVAVQGAVIEHIQILERALAEMGTAGRVISVRSKDEMEGLNALVLPGGESTTISRLLHKNDLSDRIVENVRNGMAVMGTCAGCILMGKEMEDMDAGGKEVKPLGLMDMRVRRNAFGRQRESFEREIHLKGFQVPYNAVFIRAPLITRVWGRCEEVAGIDEGIVFAREGKRFALVFHPELTADTRVHRMLIEATL